MKLSLLLLPLLIASCASNPNGSRKIASDEANLPLKTTFSSTDNDLKEDGVFPIISNLSFLMSNISNSKMGKSSIKITFPTNSAELRSVKLKRVFLFADRMESKQKLQNFMQKIMFGDKPGNLKFMRELSIRIEPASLEENYRIQNEEPSSKDIENHNKVLKSENSALLKYDSKLNAGLPLNNVFLFKSKDAQATKQFIDEVISDRSVKGFEIVEDVVIVELKNDPIIRETFISTMSNYAEKLDKLGVIAIDQCTKDTCIDFKVSDENLAPLFKQHEALTLEAFIKSYNIPEMMKIRGHIEFEVKLNEEY